MKPNQNLPPGLRIPLGAGWAILCATAALPDVTLAPLFRDGAILQRDKPLPVWGCAQAGEPVEVRFHRQVAKSVADEAGHWRVVLAPEKGETQPAELIVTGRNTLRVSDVLVGEVWLCSGQSNMEWMLSGADDAAVEIARPANPRLRQFAVKRSSAHAPRDDCEGGWSIASPESSARFSAVAYHFGRKIQQETGVAVGVINASWGGTPIELWLSERAIASDPDLRASYQRNLEREPRFGAELRAFAQSGRAWAEKFQREDRVSDPAAWAKPTAAAPSGWIPVVLPEGLEQAALPKSGAVWLRRTLRVPERIETIGLERGFLVSFGALAGFDQVYWNGRRIGESSWDQLPPGGGRRYAVPPALLEPGATATLAIRIFNPLDTGFALSVPEGAAFLADTVDLRGEWQVATEFALPGLPPGALAAYPRNPPRAPTMAGRIFNGVIAPVAGYGLRGFIWYQGESNAGRAVQYATTFPLLIRDWRAQWGADDLPFYFCQLANANAKPTQPGESGWAELREAQARTLALPRTGQAVLIDIGEEDDLHPRNKREAAERLARIALAHEYGKAVVSSGPVFDAATIEGAIVRVRFRHTEGGLVAQPLPESYRPRSTQPRTVPLRRHSPGGPVEGFAICGADRRWVWADAAVITGDTVAVSSRQVSAPIAVRYAWADNPTCNLYNGAGLPAAPFRTDAFPLSTANAKF